jgi:periplasmic protein TonB
MGSRRVPICGRNATSAGFGEDFEAYYGGRPLGILGRNRIMPMLEERTKTDLGIAPEGTASPERQRRQMLIALSLLLTALIVVIVKDRQFWMPTGAPITDDSTDAEATPTATPSDEPAAKGVTTTPRAPKSKTHTASAPSATMNLPATAGPSISASNRAALPPLEIEVVAGDQRRPVATINPSVKVDMQSGVPPIPAGPVLASVPGPASTVVAEASRPATTNAGERVRLSPDTAQVVERPVEPSYPMLAKQMKVQGSVILQALIGREGTIQDLRVLSGPAILSTAAMDAVKQWRFRPYFQAGQAIETEARITVNFTISTY